jgi:uncharacterized Zn finger protein (UPF0148 family)
MSIAVRCTNILRFDPQQGKYVRCNHEFRVKEGLAGQTVRCPTCGQSVSVSEARIAESAAVTTVSPSSPVSESRPAGNRASSKSRDRAAEVSKATPEAGLPPPALETAADPELLDDDDEFRLLAPIELPQRDLLSPSPPKGEKTTASPRSPLAPSAPPEVSEAEHPADEKAPCPGCGRPLMTRSVICTSCGYHKGLNRRVGEFDDSEDEDKPTGFERWLRRQLAEGEDPDAVRNMLIVAGLLMMAVGAVLFLMIGHLVWIVAGAAGILAAGARLGWWKLDPWQWLLLANRMLAWRHPLPPFAHRKVLDLRNMPIGDGELGALQNLAEFDVIDLEGASVTDHGLAALYDYRNLQFIILRETQTTEEGVRHLQQALPSAWIWR